MEKIDEKNFFLSKVKIDPKKSGLEANYQINTVVENDPSIIDRQESCDRAIHPDLQGLFKDLRNIVARVFGITSFLTLIESDDMKLPESKRAIARGYANELVNKIEVRGVNWSGQDENRGVIITAVFETSNGLKTCINTPRIKLSTISFGFEEELEKITDAIKGEVYKYLFEGKQAQLSLFGDAVSSNAGTTENPDENM